MQKDQLRNINPNHLHGCHPLDLRSYFGESPFCLTVKKPKDPFPPISPRLLLLERILGDISRRDLPAKEYFSEYMRRKYRYNCKPNTLRQAATSLMQFFSFYRDTGKQDLEQMTREDIEAFIEGLQDRGLTPNTVRTRLCAVYAFVRFLIEKKAVNYELLERRIKLKLPDRLPRAIDPEDLKQLLSVIDKVRDRALLLLLLRTGMRIGELLNTKLHDVDLNNHRILIYESEKNSVGRVVYYSGDAKEALLSWLRVRNTFKENLFYGQRHKPLSYEAARCMFNKYLEKAGLLYSGYTLHCLRHTFATDLLNARMPLECLRVLLGHTSLEVTRIYARLTDKTREQEYFMAMERILKGEPDADDPCDY
ncbi:MAG: tyrosine-type recombinase/integrase [Deltaproteobacteria bacterium]|nr:tyrosine-type recombinase/integrase [Deltaproteobacteria bacterium]